MQTSGQISERLDMQLAAFWLELWNRYQIVKTKAMKHLFL